MTEEFDHVVGRWLRERAVPDPDSLATVYASLATLPPQAARRPRLSAVAAAVAVLVVALGTVAILGLPRSIGGPMVPLPPDPAAFADDPRVGACFGDTAPVEFVFEMPHARDYQRHLPNMLLAPELDVDEPGFVLIFAAGAHPMTEPAASMPTDPTHRTICVLVRETPSIYDDVDVTGMRVDLGDAGTATPAPSRSDPPDPGPPTTQTEAPAPSWAADLLAQLECDGPSQSIGGETGEVAGEAGSSVSPEAAMTAFLASTFFASIPVKGYEMTDREGHYARFANSVDGRVKAIVILRDQGPDQDRGVWTPVGLRACDQSEFASGDGLSFDQTLWLDGNGDVERADRIHSNRGPEHCGWQTAVFLWFEGIQYLRDPSGVLAALTVVAFDANTALPDGARDTGLHTDYWRLFVDDGAHAVWIETSDGSVERPSRRAMKRASPPRSPRWPGERRPARLPLRPHR